MISQHHGKGLPIGTLVRPRPGVLELPDQVIGLVRSVRGSNVQVWFPDHHTIPWLKTRDIVRLIPFQSAPDHPWVQVSRLILATQATAFDWEPSTPPVLTTQTRGIDRKGLATILQSFNAFILDWSIHPGGMGSVTLEWTLDFPSPEALA